MTTRAAQRDRWITGALGFAAIAGAALMVLARGEWVLWAIFLALTTVALGGLGYFIGKARR